MYNVCSTMTTEDNCLSHSEYDNFNCHCCGFLDQDIYGEQIKLNNLMLFIDFKLYIK